MAKASASSVISGSVDEVWKVVGDFGGISNWHPAIAASAIEGGGAGDAAGCIRECTLDNGAKLREEQVQRSDAERSYSYNLLEAPMPVQNYLGKIQLKEAEGNQTLVEWTSEFDVAAEAEGEMVGMMNNVYQAGLDALKGRFAV